VSQSSEFCRHNPLCCFSKSNTKGKLLDTTSYISKSTLLIITDISEMEVVFSITLEQFTGKVQVNRGGKRGVEVNGKLQFVVSAKITL
jgi:hypothetical protein